MGTKDKRKLRVCAAVVLTAMLLLGAKNSQELKDESHQKKVTVKIQEEKSDAALGKKVEEKIGETIKENAETIGKIVEENAEIVSRVRPQINADGRIAVECILQNPELPTGCEATAGTMLLRAYGLKTDKMEVARGMKKCEISVVDGVVYAGHPDEVFIGNPETKNSYGAFPNVLAEIMQKIIDEQGGGYRAEPMYGKSEEEILQFIDNGIPVCIWSSIGNSEIEYRRGWYLIRDGEYTDEYFEWPSNEHALVLTGYDNDKVFVCDPQKGEYSYPRKSFFRHYEQVGCYSLVMEQN